MLSDAILEFISGRFQASVALKQLEDKKMLLKIPECVSQIIILKEYSCWLGFMEKAISKEDLTAVLKGHSVELSGRPD